MKTCTHCGEENNASAKLCSVCCCSTWATERSMANNMKTTLFWEVDEIVHGKLQPAGSGSTAVDGGKAEAMAHWDKCYAPHGFRLVRIDSA